MGFQLTALDQTLCRIQIIIFKSFGTDWHESKLRFLENMMSILPQIYVEVIKNAHFNVICAHLRQVLIKNLHKICLVGNSHLSEVENWTFLLRLLHNHTSQYQRMLGKTLGPILLWKFQTEKSFYKLHIIIR